MFRLLFQMRFRRLLERWNKNCWNSSRTWNTPETYGAQFEKKEWNTDPGISWNSFPGYRYSRCEKLAMSDKLTVSVEEEENGEVGPGNNGNGGKRTKSPFEGTVVVKVFYKIHRNSIRNRKPTLSHFCLSKCFFRFWQ